MRPLGIFLLLTLSSAAAAGPALSDRPPPGAEVEFRTDFSRHTLDYAEVLSGGPPKDGIPAIDAPRYVSVAAAAEWLAPREPVVRVQIGDAARAYPLQVLTWHEIVNDELGGVPLTVTFCPLCNTAIVFERTVDGRVLDFGTTGRLRFSNLILYDRQTETWWQQATGEALAGDLTGRVLAKHPAEIVAWEAFAESHASGTVLSRETGHRRSYGRNPYAGYDDVGKTPFLYRGPPTPDAMPPMERVITIEGSNDAVAFPYRLLEQSRVANETVGEQPVVVFWGAGTASALDASAISAGRDVGAATAWSRVSEGQTLDFEVRGEAIVDRQTGSTWNLYGQATAGPLAGRSLDPVVAINHFWFSWAAFRPETRIYSD
jgi:hypothetical protein